MCLCRQVSLWKEKGLGRCFTHPGRILPVLPQPGMEPGSASQWLSLHALHSNLLQQDVQLQAERSKDSSRPAQSWPSSSFGEPVSVVAKAISVTWDHQTLTDGDHRQALFHQPCFPSPTGTWLPEQSVLQAQQALWSDRRKPKAGSTLSGYQEVVQTSQGRLTCSKEL